MKKSKEIGRWRDAIFKHAIVLCNAGINQSKAADYLKSQYMILNFPAYELEYEVTKAYAKFQVQFGSERGQYQNYETYRKTHPQKQKD